MSTEPIMKVMANKADKMSDCSDSSDESSSEDDGFDNRVIEFPSSDDDDEEEMIDAENTSLTTKASKQGESLCKHHKKTKASQGHKHAHDTSSKPLIQEISSMEF